MRLRIFISLLFLISIPLSLVAQTFQKIHDLQGITDNEGTVHLFYRIMEEFENGFKKNSIYHLNTETLTDTLFLEDFSNPVVEITERINEVSFFESNPQQFIYTKDECSSGCNGFIYRNNETVFEGIFSDFQNLHTTGSDQDTVYVNIAGNVIISDDGGKTWPSDEEIDTAEGDEPFLLNFPLIYLSPLDKELMFGINSFHNGSERIFRFVKSDDGGESIKGISDNFDPLTMEFDIDGSHIYLISKYNNAESFSGDLYEFLVSSQRGDSLTWDVKQQFEYKPQITVDSLTEGMLYISQENRLFQSSNFGDTFEYTHTFDESITGLYKAKNDSLFISTRHSLYIYTGGEYSEIKKLPVSIERNNSEIPGDVSLYPNYPNPFNPTTTIRFTLPKQSEISLVVYDMLGREVARLVDDLLPAGTQTVRFDASNLANGVYIYRLQVHRSLGAGGRANQQERVRMMTLIK